MTAEVRNAESWRLLAGGSTDEYKRHRPIQRMIQSMAEQVSGISSLYNEMLADITKFHDTIERVDERDARGVAADRSRRRQRRANITDEGAEAIDSDAPVDGGRGGAATAKTDLQRQLIAVALRKHYLFNSLSEELVEGVIDAMQPRSVDAGEALIKQGEPGDKFFVVEHGTLDVEKDGVRVKVYEGGDCFGELALMYNCPRAATVRAAGTTLTGAAAFAGHDATRRGGASVSGPVRVWWLGRRLFKQTLAAAASKRSAEASGFLSGVKLLEGLTPSEISKLAGALKPHRFDDGDVIVRQGEPGHTFFIVQSGRVSVRQWQGRAPPLSTDRAHVGSAGAIGGKSGARTAQQRAVGDLGSDSDDSDSSGDHTASSTAHGNGDAEIDDMVEVTTLHAGEYFGEMALISNAPRAATVVAVGGPVHCLSLGQTDFVELLGPLRELMDHHAAARVLRAVPLLRSLSEDELHKVASAACARSYVRGETIIREGETGDHFYMLREGEVVVSQWSTSLQAPVELMRLGRNEYFGERALLRCEPRVANVVVESERAECLVLERNAFKAMLGGGHADGDTLQQRLDREIELREADAARRSSQAEGGGNDDGGLRDLHHGVRHDLAGRGTSTDDDIQRLYDTVPADRKPIPLDTSIALSDIRMGRTLGRGTFGVVKLVQHVPSKRACALKCISKANVIAMKQLRNVVKEKETMAATRHPFIIQLISTFQDARWLYMLLELVAHGELWALLYEKEDALETGPCGGLQLTPSLFYTAIVVCALEDIHSRGFAYRDLKPENLLVDARGYLKLCDFGFTTRLPYTRASDGAVVERSFTLCGTPEYLAPELVLGEGHTAAVDFWALGVLLYELLCGQTPFDDESQPKVFEKIVGSQRHLRFPRGFDAHAKSLVRKLMHPTPALRLGSLKGGVAEIRSHRFFTANELDFGALLRYEVAAPHVPEPHTDVFAPGADLAAASASAAAVAGGCGASDEAPLFEGDDSVFAGF